MPEFIIKLCPLAAQISLLWFNSNINPVDVLYDFVVYPNSRCWCARQISCTFRPASFNSDQSIPSLIALIVQAFRNGLTHANAASFCKATGRRLPTLDEVCSGSPARMNNLELIPFLPFGNHWIPTSDADNEWIYPAFGRYYTVYL